MLALETISPNASHPSHRPMKAISLHQPYASLMAVGAKTIETRHWPTDYRGLLAIHAAKRKVIRELAVIFRDQAILDALSHEVLQELPFGKIVAVVDLHDCLRTETLQEYHDHWINAEAHFGNFDLGRFGWLTRNLQRLKQPVATRGFQSFWNLPADIEAQVRAQL